MKLDLKKIAEVIRSKENGPEDPLAKVKEALAKQGLEYDPKTKAVRSINPNKPVAQNEMNRMFAETLQTFNMTPQGLQGIAQVKSTMPRSEQVVPETGDALRKRLLDEGIFRINKDGDFMPTESYFKLKREGNLWKYRL